MSSSSLNRGQSNFDEFGLDDSVEGELLRGLDYLEREARGAELYSLADTIRCTAERYLSARASNSWGTDR